MKCSLCNASATFKCCTNKYYCPLHFEPHFASSRGHSPERLDKVLTPYESNVIKIELVTRINQLISAKLEISKKTCELVKKIKKLKFNLLNQIETYLQRYSFFLNIKETCRSDYVHLKNLSQSLLEIPNLNINPVEKLLETSYSLKVENIESIWKKAKWEKNQFHLTHCSEFTCGLISKNEHFLITGSKDSYLRVWDTENISQLFLYEGHTRPILCLDLSENSKYAFSGSEDRTLRIWNLHAKKQKAVLKHSGQVQSVVFIIKSGIIVSGSLNSDKKGLIYIWEFKGLSIVNIIQTGFTELRCFIHLEIEPMLLFSTQCKIKFLNLGTCLLELKEKKHVGNINCVLITEDSKTLITGCEDAYIVLWNLENEILVHYLAGHQDSVTSLAFTKDGFSIISGSKDKSIRLWCLISKTQLLKLEDYSNFSVTLFSFKSNFIVLMDDSSFGFVDIARKSFRKSLRLRKFIAGTEQFIGNNKVAYVADFRCTIWNLNENAEDCLVILENPTIFTCFFDDEYAVVVCKESTMYWNLKRNELIAVLQKCDGKVLCGCFNYNGSKVALGYKNNLVILWSLSNIIQEQAVFSNGLSNYFWPKKTQEGISIAYAETHLSHKNSVKAVQFTSNSLFLITGGKDLKITIWDLITKTQITVLNGHQTEILELKLTEDDKYLISGGYTKKTHMYEGVKVWNIAEKTLIFDFDSQEKAQSWFNENKVSLDPFKKFLL